MPCQTPHQDSFSAFSSCNASVPDSGAYRRFLSAPFSLQAVHSSSLFRPFHYSFLFSLIASPIIRKTSPAILKILSIQSIYRLSPFLRLKKRSGLLRLLLFFTMIIYNQKLLFLQLEHLPTFNLYEIADFLCYNLQVQRHCIIK